MDFKSFEEVDRLTIAEYNMLMEAVQLKQIDKDYRNHLQAFLNFSVKAGDFSNGIVYVIFDLGYANTSLYLRNISVSVSFD